MIASDGQSSTNVDIANIHVYIVNIRCPMSGQVVMMTRRFPLLIVLSVASVVAAGCGRSAGSDAVEIQPRAVRTVEVRAEDGMREVRLSGVSRAARRATLSFLVNGTLAERPIELGQAVRAGDLLARLFNPALEPAVASGEARVRELEARLEQLQRDVSRAEDLRSRGLISDEEVEKVRTERTAVTATRDLAKASLAEARGQLAEAVLTAPFDATIDAVHFEKGEFVAAGQAVVELSGTGDLEVELEIPESLISGFETGRYVTLEFPFLDRRLVEGTVVHVGDAGTDSGGLFPVEIRMPAGPGLRPGMTAELVMEIPSDPGLVVPLAAILDPGTGNPRVFRVADGQVEPVYVKVGQLSGDMVQVQGALHQGDHVVVTGLSSLTPGQKVEELR